MATAEQVARSLFAANAIKLRAALLNSLNAENVVKAYLDTHPIVSDEPAQDRARAQAWAKLHVSYDLDNYKLIMRKFYASCYAHGLNAGAEKMAKRVRANKSAVITSRIDHASSQAQIESSNKIDLSNYTINWDNWVPGNEAAALLAKTPGKLDAILSQMGTKVSYLNQTSDSRLATALTDGIASGKTVNQIASDIRDAVASPSRALTIAMTEGAIASNAAQVQMYQDNGVEQVQWTVSDPCNECADLEGEVRNIGDEFLDGISEPPVHPNCMCALEPVMPEDLQGIGEDTSGDGTDTTGDGGDSTGDVTDRTGELTDEQYADLETLNGLIPDSMEEASSKTLINSEDLINLQGKINLTDEEKIAVKDYTGSYYHQLNNYLRFNLPEMSPLEQESMQQIVDWVKSAIDKAPALKEDLLTARGIRTADDVFQRVLESAQPGDIITDKGFVSTSLHFRYGTTMSGDYRFEILNPAGTKGLYVGPYSRFTDEYEWLLPPGTKFQVLENAPNLNPPTMKVKVIQ